MHKSPKMTREHPHFKTLGKAVKVKKQNVRAEEEDGGGEEGGVGRGAPEEGVGMAGGGGAEEGAGMDGHRMAPDTPGRPGWKALYEAKMGMGIDINSGTQPFVNRWV